MTEENDNQIQLRSAGGIGQQSDLARRGMNAANYVTGLTARQGVDIQPTSTEYTYEFLRKWGTFGTEDGQLNCPWGMAIGGDSNIYVTEDNNNRIQVFRRVILNGA